MRWQPPRRLSRFAPASIALGWPSSVPAWIRARGDQILESVALGILSREQLSQVHWKEINATAAFLGNAEGRIGMRGKGSNKALFGLDLGDDPETTSFIAQIAAGLEARVPEGGIPGLPLPVKVVVE